MKVLYLCNVGNRDVLVEGQPLERPRTDGEAIVRQLANYAGRLSAPIIETGLRSIMQAGGQPMRVTVALFATDQPESAGRHREKDTIHLASALKRQLVEVFPRRAGVGYVEDVRIAPITANPSYYDEMYEYFGTQLSGRLAPALWDRCYVSPVGGVPAANFALLLRGVERYGEKCHPIYVPEGSRHAVAMDLTAQLRRGIVRALALEALACDEFRRAAVLLQQMEAPQHLAGLAEHAQHRLDFNFDLAAAVLQAQVEPGARGTLRGLALHLRDGLDGLLAGELEALIRELAFNARIAYGQGRYVDFLLRLFRLQEALLRLVVERALGLPTDAVKRGPDPRFVQGIGGDAGLFAHMQTPYEGRVLDFRSSPPTLPVLRHLVDYVLKSGDEATRARYAPVRQFVVGIEELGTLRNKSIGAHGFQGVSEAAIRAGYGGGGDITGDLMGVLRQLGVDVAMDPYRAVREAITAALQEG